MHSSLVYCCFKLYGTVYTKSYSIEMNILFIALSGEIFPATFPDKGPESSLRNARYLTGCSEVLDIYDCNMGLLRIGPFNYKPLRGVDLWLEQNDECILR